MADPNAVMMRFPWDLEISGVSAENTPKGFFKMNVGTFKFLFPQGLGNDAAILPFSEYDQTAKTYTRALYKGGPVVTVTRKAKKIRRVRSMGATTAESESKLILTHSGVLGTSSSTIYYTGPVWGAVSWLKKNCSLADSGAVAIRGPKGQTYNSVDPTP